MRDTCEIHARYVYHQRLSRYMYMRDTCGIHAGYMGDTCGTRISGVWVGFGGIQARPQVGLEIRILMCFIHVSRYVSHMYPECILNVSCVSRNAGQKYAKRKMLKIRKNKIKTKYAAYPDMAYRSLICVWNPDQVPTCLFRGAHTQSRANRSGISATSSRSHSCAMVRKLSGVRTRVSSLSGG